MGGRGGGAVFADQGKECGNFEPRGTSGEEVWVLQEGTATSVQPRGDKKILRRQRRALKGMW